MTAVKPWNELTEAEQTGVIHRTAARTLESRNFRELTPDRLRQENSADSFMHQGSRQPTSR